MANLREAGVIGKQLNAAEAAVFYIKTRHLFVVDNNRSATAGSRYRIEVKSCLYKPVYASDSTRQRMRDYLPLSPYCARPLMSSSTRTRLSFSITTSTGKDTRHRTPQEVRFHRPAKYSCRKLSPQGLKPPPYTFGKASDSKYTYLIALIESFWHLISWYCYLLPLIEDVVARKGLVGAGWPLSLLAPLTCKNCVHCHVNA